VRGCGAAAAADDTDDAAVYTRLPLTAATGEMLADNWTADRREEKSIWQPANNILRFVSLFSK